VRAAPLVERFDGPVVDVGSGNGSPGIPLAHAVPSLEVVLLEAERRRCEFLGVWAPPNARVVWGRAEEQATDWAGAALAKALAPPPVAAEWCLPLVRPGGAALLWLGESADLAELGRVAALLAAELESAEMGLALLRKVGPTPAGFPRRAGIARKRPLR
jgi:16S rRNA (guanine527-N7)-methyltransferase